MSYNPETLDPMSVAEQQRQLGAEWAEIYASEPVQSAEIALRNPAVYLQDVSVHSLPESLQTGWKELLDNTEQLVDIAETTKSEWNSDVSSIEKLQSRMFSGQLKPEYREPVAAVIREASDLFAKSSQLRSGNTQYYQGNIQGMQGWIKNYRQSH